MIAGVKTGQPCESCFVFRVCGCEPVGCAVAVRMRMEDMKMQFKKGCMAVKLMEFVGLCGEVPVSLLRKLPGVL